MTTLVQEIYRDANPTNKCNCNIASCNCNAPLQNDSSGVGNSQRRKSNNKMQLQNCKTQLQHITSKSPLSPRKFTETQIQQHNAIATLQNAIATHHFKIITLAWKIYRDANQTTKCKRNIARCNCNTSLQNDHSGGGNLQRRKSIKRMQLQYCKLELQRITSK